MINIVKQFYQAYETNNIEELEKLIHSNLYGARLYTEALAFTYDEFIILFTNKKQEPVEILSLTESNDSIKCQINIGGNIVDAKITIKDNKIYKIYEQLTTNLKRIKCVVSYDGSLYSGYQKQPNASSVQETIETAIKESLKINISIHSSGRTDKGVHAINQVFHFDIDTKIDPSKIKMILNSYLPDSIYIKSSVLADNTYHSRYEVKSKEYMYKINLKEYNPIQRNYEWYQENININKLNKELKIIIGEHDFTSFTKTNTKSNIRTIYNAYTVQEKDYLYIHIEGSGFLRYMVRNIVGALIAISQSKSQLSLTDIINKKDVNILKDKAPANGLYLYNVNY